jgi:hypothetical protein
MASVAIGQFVIGPLIIASPQRSSRSDELIGGLPG